MGISRNLQCKTLKTPVKMRERKNNGKQWHQQWKNNEKQALMQPLGRDANPEIVRPRGNEKPAAISGGLRAPERQTRLNAIAQ